MNRIFLLILLVIMATAVVFSSEKNRNASSLSKVNVVWASKMNQGFSVRVWLCNDMRMGLQAWGANSGSQIPVEPHLGLEYPAGSGIEHLFGAGPWIGGIVDGQRLVSEGYNGDDGSTEFYPNFKHLAREHFWRTAAGSMQYDSIGYSGYYYNNQIVVNKRGCDNDHDGKVNEDDLDGIDNDGDWNPVTDDVGADGLPDPLEVSCDGLKYDPVTNADPAGDNFDPSSRDKCHPNYDGSLPFKDNRDLYTEKNGLPDHGEPHVDEDYGAVSDNDLYCSATDTFSTPRKGGHIPMGIKVIQKTYAWQGKFAEGIIPMEYYFVNQGRRTITAGYIGFFADMDVGPTNVNSYWQHDYSCYFDSLRTAYIHNPVDRGSTPLGITVLKTPKPLDSLKYIFKWFDFSTAPGPGTNDSSIYSWMSGEPWPPDQYISPCQPIDNLSDTRFMFSFGPFDEIKPGDTLKISLAFVAGYAVDAGPNNLKENAQKALKLASRGYVPPVSLVSPTVKISSGFKTDTLKWGRSMGGIDPLSIWDDSSKLAQAYPDTHWRRRNPPCSIGSAGCGGHICDANGKLPGGRIFSGYRIYRSEDPSNTPLEKSFTLMRQIDLPDTAGQWSIDHLDSTFVDSNLVRGKRYWYAVTSYGLPDITVNVIKTNTGVRYDTLYSENAESPISGVRIDLPFSVSNRVGEVLVVPNPYRVDQEYTYENGGWEGRAKDWTEINRLIKFIHLPKKCTIRIFTLTGEEITTLYHDDPERGELNWNLLSQSNRALASGVYVFTVESDLGTQIGKFVLIR